MNFVYDLPKPLWRLQVRRLPEEVEERAITWEFHQRRLGAWLRDIVFVPAASLLALLPAILLQSLPLVLFAAVAAAGLLAQVHYRAADSRRQLWHLKAILVSPTGDSYLHLRASWSSANRILEGRGEWVIYASYSPDGPSTRDSIHESSSYPTTEVEDWWVGSGTDPLRATLAASELHSIFQEHWAAAGPKRTPFLGRQPLAHSS